MEIAADQYEKLMAHFDNFIIMDDVELVAQDPAAETAIGLTGRDAGQVLARMGLPTPASQMTWQRVEWNGIDLRIQHGYGTLAAALRTLDAASRIDRPMARSLTAGARPVGAPRSRLFALPKEFPSTASTLSSGTCRRRPRRCGRFTSARAATLARRSSNASAHGATFTAICASLNSMGRSPRPGLSS